MPQGPSSVQTLAPSVPNNPFLSPSLSYSASSPSHRRNSSLPRSHASSQRTSPAPTPNNEIDRAFSFYPQPISGHAENLAKINLHLNTSIEKSSSLTTGGTMFAGPILSPLTSQSDTSNGGRQSRQDTQNFQELEDAVRRSLSIERAGSPEDRSPSVSFDARPHSQTAGLSPAARKISHSRSTTENSLIPPPSQNAQSSLDGSDDDEDEEMFTRPPLLRKKSGELVKPAIRPRSRRKVSSMPGTPTYGKAVHFNEDLQQVRHFLQVDRPIAVSAGGSPVEAYEDGTEFPFHRSKSDSMQLGIKLTNFPRESFERRSQFVKLERLQLSSDQKTLIGNVIVANLAFHKLVVARFTFDSWKTTSEIVADYNADVPKSSLDHGYDPFVFHIKLTDQADIDTKTLLICIRYDVNGSNYWDNNNSMNYQVDFVKSALPKNNKSPMQMQGLGQRPPRSRRSSSNRPRSAPLIDDDFGHGFDDDTNFRFTDQPQRSRFLPDTPPVRVSQSGQQFGSRYDFGTSLTAALSQAQAQLGEKSGIQLTKTEQEQKSKREQSSTQTSMPPKSALKSNSDFRVRSNPVAGSPRPDALLANNKQPLDSRAYQEFVSKFCFFGSGKPSTTNSTQTPSNDGSNDEAPPNSTSQEVTSAVATQTQGISSSKNQMVDQSFPDSCSVPESRSRTPSPLDHGYSLNNHASFFSAGPGTPPAIHG